MAFTHFVTQFTHVSRHSRVKNENKTKKFRENCFENEVSDLSRKKCMCPQNYFLLKVQQLKTTKS